MSNCTTFKQGAFHVGCLFLGSLLWVGMAGAAPITVPNFSFESPVAPSLGLISGDPTDWHLTVGGGGVIDPFINNGYPHPATDGNQVAFVNGAQSLVETLAASPTNFASDTTYTVLVDTAGVVGNSDVSIRLVDQTGAVVASTPLLALATTWTPGALVYVSGPSNPLAGTPLRIELTALDNIQTIFDNVRLDAVTVGVPEPAAGILFGLGIVGLLAARRFRRNRD